MRSCRIWWVWVVGAAIPCLRAAEAIFWWPSQRGGGLRGGGSMLAAFYLDDDPGVLVKRMLCLATGPPPRMDLAARGPSGLRGDRFSTLHQPENRDSLSGLKCGRANYATYSMPRCPDWPPPPWNAVGG